MTGRPMSEEEHEDTHRVPVVRDESHDDIGSYLITLQVKQDMQRAIDEGMSFPDAAEKAGLPADLAYSRTLFDPDFRGMWDAAQGREVKDKRHKKFNGLDHITGLQVKKEFVQKLYAAGLFDKIAALAALADPTTKDGQNVLGFFMRHVIKDVLPGEMTSMIEHSVKPASKVDPTEAEARLAKLREKNAKLEQEKMDAERRLRELAPGDDDGPNS